MFDSISHQAQAISNLFILTLLIATVILLLVTGLVLYASFRYRSRPGDGEPRQVFGHRNLEIAWTAAPAVLLAVLAVLTLYTMRLADPAVGASAQPDVVITGHQWWWEVRYPQSGVVTANEIHLPVQRKMLAEIDSADVIHSFWVPQLGRKMDAIPGHPNHLWLEADTSGTYLGTCAEYCGTQHAWMRIRVIVQPPAEFDAWLHQQQQPPAIPTIAEAAQGKKLFEQKTCIACHTRGIGPDLTHVGSRETLAAGVLDNTPANMATWLKNPQAVKPGSDMPDFNLTDSEIKALVAYLEASK
jgi:cytochrome c oxidase subunit 2